jgi:hypothetical protein
VIISKYVQPMVAAETPGALQIVIARIDELDTLIMCVRTLRHNKICPQPYEMQLDFVAARICLVREN